MPLLPAPGTAIRAGLPSWERRRVLLTLLPGGSRYAGGADHGAYPSASFSRSRCRAAHPCTSGRPDLEHSTGSAPVDTEAPKKGGPASLEGELAWSLPRDQKFSHGAYTGSPSRSPIHGSG